MSAVEIYGLYDPRTDELRYIGKARNSKKRLAQHLRETHRRTPVYDWINSLRKIGIAPIVKVLSSVEEGEWEHEERRLIFESRLTAPNLLNLADGANEPKCSKEQRSKNGLAVATKIHSNPRLRQIWYMKLMIGSSLRDGYVSNKARAKLREAARKCPSLFGNYANLPDRIEEAA